MTLLHAEGRGSLVPAIVWLLLLCLCAVYAVGKLAAGDSVESNILGLMPEQLVPVQDRRLGEQITRLSERKFLILLKGADSEAGLKLAEALEANLQKLDQVSLATGDSGLEQAVRAYYFPFRHQLLSAEWRQKLQDLGPQQIAEQQLRQLYSPVRAYAPYRFEDDPFNLGGGWIQSLPGVNRQFMATAIPSIKDGPDNWYLLRGELLQSPFALELQQRLQTTLSAFRQQHADTPFELLTSGLIFHATQGSVLARSEISTVGAGSLLAVVALVIAVFRSTTAFFFILGILASSTLVALSITWLAFDRIHLVTLAFGSTLLGLAADYCFHFLVKCRASGNPGKARQLIFKGLLVSCLSSMAAYLIQLFSPFPGLRQFAVFVASGLAAACIGVLLAGPLFRPGRPDVVGMGRAFVSLVQPFYRRAASAGLPWLVVGLILVLAAVFQLYRQGVSDDIRLLNTSGSQLLAAEKKVQQLLGNIGFHRYFLLEGDSPEQVLQRAEQLERAVSARFAVGTDPVLLSPADAVPSQRQQRADYRLIGDKILGPGGAAAILCQALNSDCDWLDGQLPYNPHLVTEEVPEFLATVSPTLGLLRNNSAVVFIGGGGLAEQILQTDWKLQDVAAIDQVASLTDILKHYRQHVSSLLAIFALCLFAGCLLLFGRRGLLVVISVASSSLVALSVAVDSGITLFHILALMLVIGIAVDTAVFFITPGLDADTWTASSLACLTSLIAFGLLSLSQVPLLSQFGSVVFFGLVAAWLITPLIYYLFGSEFFSHGIPGNGPSGSEHLQPEHPGNATERKRQ